MQHFRKPVVRISTTKQPKLQDQSSHLAHPKESLQLDEVQETQARLYTYFCLTFWTTLNSWVP